MSLEKTIISLRAILYRHIIDIIKTRDYAKQDELNAIPFIASPKVSLAIFNYIKADIDGFEKVKNSFLEESKSEKNFLEKVFSNILSSAIISLEANFAKQTHLESVETEMCKELGISKEEFYSITDPTS